MNPEKLLNEDYFEKEYAEGGSLANYPFEEAAEDGSVRRWKKVPLKLTDEEFERLQAYYPSGRYEPETPPLVGVLQVVAWGILIAAALIGIAAGEGFTLVAALLGAVPLTALFLALAEIVKKLHHIEKAVKKKRE